MTEALGHIVDGSLFRNFPVCNMSDILQSHNTKSRHQEEIISQCLMLKYLHEKVKLGC